MEKPERKGNVIWSIKWYSKNKLDGISNHLICGQHGIPILFSTRKRAKEFIRINYGYINDRQDLRREPFGWRLPKAVKVLILERTQIPNPMDKRFTFGK